MFFSEGGRERERERVQCIDVAGFVQFVHSREAVMMVLHCHRQPTFHMIPFLNKNELCEPFFSY